MKTPFSIGLSATLSPNPGTVSPLGHRLELQNIFHDSSPLFWEIFGRTSLYRPQIIFADTGEKARAAGLCLLERHSQRHLGWRNHFAIATDICESALSYVRSRKNMENRRLRFYVVSAVVGAWLPKGLPGHFTISGSGAGEDPFDAFYAFKRSFLDRRYPRDTRFGYAVKLRKVPTEQLFEWYEHGMNELRIRIAA